MIEHTILRNKEQLATWESSRRKHHMDFETDLGCYEFPMLVVWTETESNGYPVVEYMQFHENEIHGLFKISK